MSRLIFLFLKILFVLANSVDPDEMWHYAAFEMLHYAAFHLGLHSLPECLFISSHYSSIQRVNET